mgnify:CR=1 FL=1
MMANKNRLDSNKAAGMMNINVLNVIAQCSSIYNNLTDLSTIARVHQARCMILDNAAAALIAANKTTCPRCGHLLDADEDGVVTCPRCKHSTDAVTFLAGRKCKDYNEAAIYACKVICGKGRRHDAA